MSKPIRFINSLLENSQKLCLTSRFLIGGVFSVLALALTANPVSALDSSTTQITVHFREKFGCNTVSSNSGVLAVGPRGSYFGADDNPGGCGYYIGHSSSNQGSLTWRSNGIFGGCSFPRSSSSPASCSLPSMDPTSTSLQNDSYISKNFRTSVYSMGSELLGSDDSANFQRIEAGTGGNYLYIQIFKVKPNTISSHLTPSLASFCENVSSPCPSKLDVPSGSNTRFNDSEKEAFLNDFYENTIFEFGSPKDYVPADLYSTLKSAYGITDDSEWDSQDFAFIATILPQYEFGYYLDYIEYSVSTDLVQNNISGLTFYAREIGLGNNGSSETFPKLDYFYLSPAYSGNSFNSGLNILSNMKGFSYECISSSCSDDLSTLLGVYNSKHSNDTTGWDFASNPGGSWFDVFNFGILFPGQSFFSSLTNDRCVDIPIIASWIHSPQNRYCTWWSNEIRSTLTPVFSSISIMLLFGFIVHWLRGSDHSVISNRELKA